MTAEVPPGTIATMETTAPRSTFRIPPMVADALVAFGILATTLGQRSEVGGSGFTRDFDSLNLLLIVLQTAPLVFRRRFPVAVLAVTATAWMLDRGLDYPSTLAAAGVIIAMHSVGSELPARRSSIIGWSVTIGLTLFTVIGFIVYESVGLASVVFMAVVLAVPLYLGKEVHDRRVEFELLRERAAQAEREREAEARRAVQQERARIARELHDVVAHQMAVMTLQAEGARRLADDADPRVASALDTIRSAGHESLDEMRRMVGLLRSDDAGPVEPDLGPQPGLDDLGRLVAAMEEAGLEVTVLTEGEPRRLPSGIDLNAYRIIQESLTNALKHGGPDVHARVLIRYGSDSVDVDVSDDGRGAAAAAGNGGGHGLVGMRERVALVSGSFAAGPAPGGGFRVHAVLPVEAG
jgi:signal transduction histidine kinase